MEWLEAVQDWLAPGVENVFGWMKPGADALLPYAPLLIPLAALVAGLAAVAALRQRTRSDASDEWWKRVQFALDKSMSTDVDAQGVGTSMLRNLTEYGVVRWKPWTWRNRWRITKRDRVMVSDVVVADAFPVEQQTDKVEGTDQEERNGDEPTPGAAAGREGLVGSQAASGAPDEGPVDRGSGQEDGQEDPQGHR